VGDGACAGGSHGGSGTRVGGAQGGARVGGTQCGVTRDGGAQGGACVFGTQCGGTRVGGAQGGARTGRSHGNLVLVVLSAIGLVLVGLMGTSCW